MSKQEQKQEQEQTNSLKISEETLAEWQVMCNLMAKHYQKTGLISIDAGYIQIQEEAFLATFTEAEYTIAKRRSKDYPIELHMKYNGMLILCLIEGEDAKKRGWWDEEVSEG